MTLTIRGIQYLIFRHIRFVAFIWPYILVHNFIHIVLSTLYGRSYSPTHSGFWLLFILASEHNYSLKTGEFSSTGVLFWNELCRSFLCMTEWDEVEIWDHHSSFSCSISGLYVFSGAFYELHSGIYNTNFIYIYMHLKISYILHIIHIYESRI